MFVFGLFLKFRRRKICVIKSFEEYSKFLIKIKVNNYVFEN